MWGALTTYELWQRLLTKCFNKNIFQFQIKIQTLIPAVPLLYDHHFSRLGSLLSSQDFILLHYNSISASFYNFCHLQSMKTLSPFCWQIKNNNFSLNIRKACRPVFFIKWQDCTLILQNNGTLTSSFSIFSRFPYFLLCNIWLNSSMEGLVSQNLQYNWMQCSLFLDE